MSNEYITAADGPDTREGFQRFAYHYSQPDKADDFPGAFSFGDVEPPTETDLLPDDDIGGSITPNIYTTSAYEYDVAVIGSGPAGYTAAIRAAKLGGKVIMFEKEALGGLWLSAGCIPAKVYLKASGSEAPDLQGALSFKNNIVTKLTSNAARMLRSTRVRVEAGEAVLKTPNEIVCRGRAYTAAKIIVCGGTKADGSHIPGASHPEVCATDAIFRTSDLPKRLMILGGGSEGCELAAAFAAFGSNVILVETQSRLLPGWDAQVADAIHRSLSDAGVKVYTGVTIDEISDRHGKPYVITERGGVLCDKVLLATRRRPEGSFFGSLAGDFRIENGAIAVNEYLETSVPDIYAAGDITGLGGHTHAAYRMAETAAVNAMGGKKQIDLFATPEVIYTRPEAASAGMSEEAARGRFKDGFVVGFCPLSENINAIISGTPEGFVKVLASRRHGELLGVHIVGANASELIAEPAALMRMEVTLHEVVGEIVHAHPTYAEAFAAACGNAMGSFGR